MLQHVVWALTWLVLHRNEYLAMGLFHIAKAVGFLNNDCQLVPAHQCILGL